MKKMNVRIAKADITEQRLIGLFGIRIPDKIKNSNSLITEFTYNGKKQMIGYSPTHKMFYSLNYLPDEQAATYNLTAIVEY